MTRTLFARLASFAALALLLPAVAHAQSFQPLTSIPGIAEAAASPNLTAFLNTVYKLCIGVAAVLAVVQILRGGITYMLGDGVTEKREARHHIYMAVFGLVLVLSPAIVFGIIDARILDLQINVGGLAPGELTEVNLTDGTDVGDGTGDGAGGDAFTVGQQVECAMVPSRPNDYFPGAVTEINSPMLTVAFEGNTTEGTPIGTFAVQASVCRARTGATPDPDPEEPAEWRAIATGINLNLTNTDIEPASRRTSAPYTFVVNGGQTFPNQSACESATYSQSAIHSSIKSGAYVCHPDYGASCTERQNYIKSKDTLPAGVLTLTSRTCQAVAN